MSKLHQTEALQKQLKLEQLRLSWSAYSELVEQQDGPSIILRHEIKGMSGVYVASLVYQDTQTGASHITEAFYANTLGTAIDLAISALGFVSGTDTFYKDKNFIINSKN